MTEPEPELSESQLPSDLDIGADVVEKLHAAIMDGGMDLGTEEDAAYVLFDRSDGPHVETGETHEDNSCGRSRQRSMQVPRNSLSEQSELWSDSPEKPVKIKIREQGPASEAAVTVVQLFERIVVGYGEHVALKAKRGGEWRNWTYRAYFEESSVVAKAFIELGLLPYHAVCILGFNSPEWHIAYMGAIMACGLPVGLYTSSTPENCCSIAKECKANIIVVDCDVQLHKIMQIQDQLPDLKTVILYSKDVPNSSTTLTDWRGLLSTGNKCSDDVLKQRVAMLSPDKCCTIIYTSGTSGKPNGVMISHDNLTWMGQRACHYMNTTPGEEHIVSYLALSHVATQLLDIYTALACAGTVWYAQPDAMKGSLYHTIKEVRPTIFLGVPRVWEKAAESIQLLSQNSSGFKAKVASWAKGIGLRTNLSKQQLGTETLPIGWSLANWLFFKKVRKAFGLDRCHFPMTGAAPIRSDVLDYFLSINIPIYEMYGMSETSGPTTVTTSDKIRYRSSGRVMDGAELMIKDPDGEGVGEVLIRGRNVFMGYLNQPETNRAVFTSDGWLQSGDLGLISEEGFLYITGRKKELIILASGEKIAPLPIEDALKRELPIISNAVLIGEQQRFLCCLLTLKVIVAEDTGLPTSLLSPQALSALQKVGSAAKTVSDIVDGDQKVLKMIQKGVDAVNKKAPTKIHKIAKWSILESDFSVATGELTPTLKLKRSYIIEKCMDYIASFYGSD